MDQVLKSWVSGFGSGLEYWVKQGFFSKFLPFFKVEQAKGALKNHQKWQKFGPKKEDFCLVQFPFNTFPAYEFWLQFQQPGPSLVVVVLHDCFATLQ